MSYIGKTPTQGFRQRFIFTASGSETSLSGADDNKVTPLTFTDGEYVDVKLNGCSFHCWHSTTTQQLQTRRCAHRAALTASDVVDITVYDVFSVANLSSYFTSARVPFTRFDATTKNIPLNSDQQVPFTKSDGTASTLDQLTRRISWLDLSNQSLSGSNVTGLGETTSSDSLEAGTLSCRGCHPD